METIKNELIPVLKKIGKEISAELKKWVKKTMTPENQKKSKAFVIQNKKPLMSLAALFILFNLFFGGTDSIPTEVPKETAVKASQYGLSEKGARELVKLFATPGADFWEFTQMVKPVKEDYQAYFKADIADELYEAFEEHIWNGRFSGQGLSRKPAQNYVVLRFGSTTPLKKGDKSGGFRAELTQVSEFIKDDIPYAEFDLAVQGNRTGTYYNNMAYVNGHWVIFPKLWFVLKKMGKIE